MHQDSQTPSLARLSAIFVGVFLSISALSANAQTLPEVQSLMKQGQMPQALEKVDAYISTKPKDAQGRFMRGLILTELGRSADAIAVFTKLTEDFPELPEPYNNLAVLYAQQKQYDKARTALEMAIRTHPSYSIAHENLGDVYAKLASQAYDKALQLDSSNAATQTKLSLIKDLISTTKPGKPGASVPQPAAQPAVEPVKPTATEPSAAVTPPPKPAEKAVEPAPAPKVAETKVTEEAKAPLEKPQDAVSGAEAEVKKTLLGWANAWSRKDVKAYLGYYASDFQAPKGASRKTWEAERASRIDKPGKLQVSVDDVRISITNDKATVKFRQSYVSSSLKSSTGKTLILVKSGNKWLIQQERVG
ncbi:MAG: tetratricopeptide repeat protein [Propionivibrio sp.]|jgi:tetratricopeptide (TPR) repeat protein|uniref:nuclear transport factor 2 family protein n=1 Tax=Propionivibrio sp. TaxID=2212460 RepID=UPI001B6B50E6|nr:tetratricopeptide repeat protein [Propionivibrio sp.]